MDDPMSSRSARRIEEMNTKRPMSAAAAARANSAVAMWFTRS
jgi:hypothetical protein